MYLTWSYWGVDTLINEKYDLDEKWCAITIDVHIGEDGLTPQRLVSSKFSFEHRKSTNKIEANKNYVRRRRCNLASLYC